MICPISQGNIYCEEIKNRVNVTRIVYHMHDKVFHKCISCDKIFRVKKFLDHIKNEDDSGIKFFFQNGIVKNFPPCTSLIEKMNTVKSFSPIGAHSYYLNNRDYYGGKQNIGNFYIHNLPYTFLWDVVIEEDTNYSCLSLLIFVYFSSQGSLPPSVVQFTTEDEKSEVIIIDSTLQTNNIRKIKHITIGLEEGKQNPHICKKITCKDNTPLFINKLRIKNLKTMLINTCVLADPVIDCSTLITV
jgi:hypothetical protein